MILEVDIGTYLSGMGMFDVLEILTAIVLGCYFVYRIIRIRIVGKSRLKLVEKIAQNPALAVKIADELVYFYGKSTIPEDDNFEELNYLDGAILERFTILGVHELNENQYLFITQCNDFSYTEYYRKEEKADEVYFYNFVVARNVEKNQYEVYSGKYNNLSDKNLMTRFSSLILKSMSNEGAYAF